MSNISAYLQLLAYIVFVWKFDKFGNFETEVPVLRFEAFLPQISEAKDWRYKDSIS